MVGTVVVRRGRVLATGFHRRAGLAHAEVDALSKLGGRAPGATLYVNLEPCNHRGRTEPCTEALLAAGVARVVVGMVDPNPIVNGRGLERLRKAGVRVDVGCLEEECRRLNEGFVSAMERARPFVTLKLAATADGFTAAKDGASAWVSGEPARRLVHRWRARADAVMVGAGTAIADDPALTVRLVQGRDPVRVIVDSRARCSSGARLFREGQSKVIVATTSRAPAARVRLLERAGADVLLVRAERSGRVDLRALLETLATRGVLHVLCEGGATLAGALVRAGLVDRFATFFAPKLLGGGGVPILAGDGARAMRDTISLRATSIRRVGDDVLLVSEVAPATRRQLL
jgi:diaminohydroxyphosphoribosylaminopyrimidine deaminase/5-amino-6-(5-phosphoribosylamino)uracil reductase